MDTGYKGWHWLIMLRQYSDGSVVTHDPDWWGSRRDEGCKKTYIGVEWLRSYWGFLNTGNKVYVTLS